ncbi:ferritin-like domain-containing protein [Mesoplasma lactucae]|uniref:Uncharacterized protein n=1 Tax=Mesoplasma lactucae ATCC 49193 TaxID=81460 RepID=A0A291ISK8_9MOLU|nr:ferritin-like domain-containing protein [Mesoplasma lactucae]ATG97681.1 hypothetical protein CP520_02995 [Mesoplasma lactucae ATCC 49193]ATZ19854.1 ferritin [Mesoplasma lactucae ATCC 49193]MCL8216717.1 hypothetical protein [Mesoplasma lactucae ATCC 49193]
MENYEKNRDAIKKDVETFLNMHVQSMLDCHIISQELNNAGFPGFAMQFTRQSNDEYFHQRRITDFLQNKPGFEVYSFTQPVINKFDAVTPQKALQAWIQIRTNLINAANNFRENARQLGDETTSNFYSWFLQDGFDEIEEASDLLNRLDMPSCDLARFDLKADGSPEPDRDNVINPMGAFVPD